MNILPHIPPAELLATVALYQVWALIAHMIGDYILQSHRMATRKTTDWRWCLTHVVTYGLPFALIASPVAWLIIVSTHFVLDHYALAKRWAVWMGRGESGHLWWERPVEVAANGVVLRPGEYEIVWPQVGDPPGTQPTIRTLADYPSNISLTTIYDRGPWSPFRSRHYETAPPALRLWIPIIIDNTVHVTINALALFFWA